MRSAAEAGTDETQCREAARRLRAQALRLCRRADEADDLVQETLLAGVLAGRYDLPWLSGVLRRQAALAARSGVRRRQRDATSAPPQADEDAGDPALAHVCPAEDAQAAAWLRGLPPSARRLAVLALHGLSAGEIRWLLRIEPTAFRQRLARIRRDRPEWPPACPRAPARSVDLEFGLARRALKAAMRAGEGLGTHDLDGHLLLIDAGAHASPFRGNRRTGTPQEEIPC